MTGRNTGWRLQKCLALLLTALVFLCLPRLAGATGVTVIAHGFGGDVEGWITNMADAVFSRQQGAAATQTRYTVQIRDPFDLLSELTVELAAASGPSPITSPCPEIVVLLCWSDVAGSFENPFDVPRSTVDVATAVLPKLLDPTFLDDLGRPLAELPLHFIGHSRGASLVNEIAQQLGERGIWVDHVTTLDPHPVDGVREPILPIPQLPIPDWGDAPMSAWENIVLFDNYWRTSGDGDVDFTGEPVTHAHNLQLLEAVLNQTGYTLEHSDAHLWYHGTVDTSMDPAANDGTHDVPDSWYEDEMGPRTEIGYFYSRIAGGPQTDLSDGVSTAFGGEAERIPLTQRTDTQWPNIGQIDILDPEVTAGDPVSISFLYQDRDSTTRIQFYFDGDTNPYNGNGTLVDDSMWVQTGDDVSRNPLELDTTDVAPGQYYIYGEISDPAEQTRYAHTQDQVTILGSAVDVVAGLAPRPERILFDNDLKALAFAGSLASGRPGDDLEWVRASFVNIGGGEVEDLVRSASLHEDINRNGVLDAADEQIGTTVLVAEGQSNRLEMDTQLQPLEFGVPLDYLLVLELNPEAVAVLAPPRVGSPNATMMCCALVLICGFLVLRRRRSLTVTCWVGVLVLGLNVFPGCGGGGSGGGGAVPGTGPPAAPPRDVQMQLIELEIRGSSSVTGLPLTAWSFEA